MKIKLDENLGNWGTDIRLLHESKLHRSPDRTGDRRLESPSFPRKRESTLPGNGVSPGNAGVPPASSPVDSRVRGNDGLFPASARMCFRGNDDLKKAIGTGR